MVLSYSSDISIILPETNRQEILHHCRQALDAFRLGKTEEGKAFGLVFGKVVGKKITVTNCFPLQRNVRSRAPYKEFMDKVMVEHAVVSQTPLPERGWVADPVELFDRIKECRRDHNVLIGSYHMHRVGWDHDPVRDTPTKLDAVLAEESGLLMFIVSMVEPELPIIRTFYEGKKDCELQVGVSAALHLPASL